jgi:hypothetical protein
VSGVTGARLRRQLGDPASVVGVVLLYAALLLASAAAALAVLTVVVVICFTLVLVELFHWYNSPRSFANRLYNLSMTGKRQLPPVMGALRQWLCTAARGGLVGPYKRYADGDPAYRTALASGRWEPEAGWQSDGSRRSGLNAAIRKALASASDAASERAKDAFSPWHREAAAAPVESWFAEQLSGALVRATEEAARADIAWRGLDELLCTSRTCCCAGRWRSSCSRRRGSSTAVSSRSARWPSRPRAPAPSCGSATRRRTST